jgi:hypothetical protein
MNQVASRGMKKAPQAFDDEDFGKQPKNGSARGRSDNNE